MRYFYTHLVKIDSLIYELDRMQLSGEEKSKLSELIDSSLHHTILDAILSELSDEDKRVFVNHLTEDNHQKIWQFLNERIDGVEDKIKKVVEDLKAQLHKDLREAKQK